MKLFLQMKFLEETNISTPKILHGRVYASKPWKGYMGIDCNGTTSGNKLKLFIRMYLFLESNGGFVMDPRANVNTSEDIPQKEVPLVS